MGKPSIVKIPFLGLICYRNRAELIKELILLIAFRIKDKYEKILEKIFNFLPRKPIKIDEVERKMLTFIIVERGRKNPERKIK